MTLFLVMIPFAFITRVVVLFPLPRRLSSTYPVEDGKNFHFYDYFCVVLIYCRGKAMII